MVLISAELEAGAFVDLPLTKGELGGIDTDFFNSYTYGGCVQLQHSWSFLSPV